MPPPTGTNPTSAVTITNENETRHETSGAHAPKLEINWTHGVITGLRFAHTRHCGECRKSVELHTDGGTVRAGIYVNRNRKTVRWYHKELPGSKPVPPERCPHCGTTWTPIRYPDAKAPTPVTDYRPLLDEIWQTLRRDYPALATKADADLRRQAARKRATRARASRTRAA